MATDEPDLTLDLYEVKETGEYKSHTDELVRQHIISGFVITVRRTIAVHGTYSKTDKTPTSLLAYRFKLSSKRSTADRRIRSLLVKLRFERDPKEDPIDDPCVLSYAPAEKGEIAINETVEIHNSSSSSRVNPSIGASGVKLSGEIAKQSGALYEKKFYTNIQAEKLKSSRAGRKGEDLVQFNLTENASQKDGVVDTFGVVAFVNRRDAGDKFKVHMDIKAEVDFRYTVGEAWEKVTGHRDKPLQVNPKDPNVAKPDGLETCEMGKFAESDMFERLAFLHLPESYNVTKFYN
ncbi:hypothetical protein GP486_002096 [Trichoglossum hirsutum]|uniref:Uncharacterized protein n=1 Tax=Trichoglossum hirsutum TaxID=265104 RepID=A0A9P8RSF8_9PEZI|nr:hypothetical protein GP486_002096 [Trichoglossum hirsutum]